MPDILWFGNLTVLTGPVVPAVRPFFGAAIGAPLPRTALL
jgi:hypothetical protein